MHDLNLSPSVLPKSRALLHYGAELRMYSVLGQYLLRGWKTACKTAETNPVIQAPLPLCQNTAPNTTAVTPSLILQIEMDRGCMLVN